MDPDAVSPVGAAGIAQFMPAVWVDVTRRLGWGAAISPHLAGPAIEAGAYFMGTLRKQWNRNARSGRERNDLALGSYNAGIGSILKAQHLCGDARLWPQIAPCLVQITGKYSTETLTYVGNIARWQAQKEARTP